VGVAVLLSVAALIVALTGRGRQPVATMPTNSSQTSAAGPPSDMSAADRELSKAIAPLIKESSAEKNAFVALGLTGTSERDAGIPDFVAQTKDWVTHTQRELDAHADPPRFMTRTLQRYVDDMRLYAANIRPGPATDADTASWTDSLVALGGPFEVCEAAGVQLW
jgi:hypothetical protein